jgi:ABC-type uncharacterized transport system permease subunit
MVLSVVVVVVCAVIVSVFFASMPVHAQVSTATSTGTTTLPNTGVGGDTVKNLSLMLVSGVAALGGILFMLRRFA